MFVSQKGAWTDSAFVQKNNVDDLSSSIFFEKSIIEVNVDFWIFFKITMKLVKAYTFLKWTEILTKNFALPSQCLISITSMKSDEKYIWRVIAASDRFNAHLDYYPVSHINTALP